MRVAFYRDAFDNWPKSEELTWAELVAKLSRSRASPKSMCAKQPCDGKDTRGRPCDGKNGAAWSPVEIETRRLNENVKAVTVGVFDIDDALDDSWFERLRASGVEFVVHSTHQYPLEERFRVVMPLSRPVTPAEWRSVHEAITTKIGIPADPLKDLSRLYFLPNHVEGTQPLYHHEPGKPLDVDHLKSVKSQAETPKQPVPPITPEPVDMTALEASIRKHVSEQNRALVVGALKGESLGPKSGANRYGGQDNALQALMSTVAFCAPDGTPWDAVEHLLRPCFGATDWGEGTEALARVARDKWERALERKAARDAQRAAENAAMLAAVGIAREARAKPATVDEGAEDPDRWVEKLIMTDGKEQKIAVCEANVLRVLRNCDEWKDAIRFNDVSKQLELKNPPSQIRNIESLDAALSIWFQESAWGRAGLKPRPQMIGEVLRLMPERAAYDPLLEFLDGLVWDGVKRIDSLFERYFKAEGDPVEYLRAISRRWLISLVARGLKPGSKVDTVLCLEGKQGLMKSTALRTLTEPWFSDSKIDVGNKDTWAAAAQVWLIELAEAEGMTKAQAEALKGFFSKRDDFYRPPYGRTNVTTLRRAIFAVTTNAQRFLKFDPTGYRRYWPVTCTAIDLESLKRDREQLLAEAVAAFRAGEEWFFWPGTPAADLQETAARKREETLSEASKDIVLEWLLAFAKEKRPSRVKIVDILTDPKGFGLQRHQLTRGREMELAEVLKSMGFEKFQSNGGRCWRVPDDLLEAAPVVPIRPHEPEPIRSVK